jgi:hypothetical protein
MECVGEALVDADPRQYPIAPRPGACFPDGAAPSGFCEENCEAQARVCGRLYSLDLAGDICVTAECNVLPPCELTPEGTCDRCTEMCAVGCIIDEECSGESFCTNWGECWEAVCN